MEDARCRIELLGGLRVVQGTPPGRVTEKFRTRKAAALLAFLALRPGVSHGREYLVELFWPDMDPAAGRDNLSTALSSLRKQLEPPGSGIPSGSILSGDWQSVRLNPAAVTTDVAEFEALLSRASARPAPPAADRSALLGRAVALYGGTLLPGFYDEWAVSEQDRLAARFADALASWADALEESGDPAGALAAWRRLDEADPDREDVERAIARLSSAAAQTPSPPSPAPKESPPPAAAPADGAAPPQGASVHLPLTLTRFVGREEERAAVVGLLSGGARLVTLTGPGGIGKTRLSVEAARGAAAEGAFPGGVCFAALADVPRADVLPLALLSALRLPREPVGGAPPEPMARICEHLASRAGRFLLVLDNLEHLIAARAEGSGAKGDCPGARAGSVADLVLRLLECAPALSVFATSRQALGVAGESLYPLSPLPAPEEGRAGRKGGASSSAGPLAAPAASPLLAYPAVALYADRARMALPDFAVTERNGAAVAALCRRLEGVPLAIEMAAAWVRTVPPARMLELLGDRLDALTARQKDLPARHRSLRAAIEWGHDLLPGELRRMFARLSVFRGGFTAEAAGEVCGTDPFEAAGAVEELLNRSMVTTAAGCDGTEDEPRYRLLEPLREFAAERLKESGEAEAARRAHAGLVLSLAEEAGRHYSLPDSGAWLARLECEHDNLRTALDWALGADPALAVRIGATVWEFWEMRGHLQEGRARLKEVVTASAGAEVPVAMRAQALNGLGTLCLRQEALEEAEQWLTEAVRLWERCGALRGLAGAIQSLGVIAGRRGDMPRALEMIERAVEVHRRAGDQKSVGQTLNNLGNARRHHGDLAGASACYAESLEIVRGNGDRVSEAIVLTNLGETAWQRGDLAAARAYQQESRRIAESLGYKRVVRYALHGLGVVALTAGEVATAREHLAAALRLSREIGLGPGFVDGIYALAAAAAVAGDGARAATLFAAADAEARRTSTSAAPALRAFYDTHRTAPCVASLTTDARTGAEAAGLLFDRVSAVAFALGED